MILGGIGVVGGVISGVLGGWDAGIAALLWAMAIDFASGLVVAGVFKKSGKSESGALDSRAGWKGLLRKGMTLAIVIIAVQLDALMDTNFIRDAVVIAYIANEILSIAENAGLMGVPFPEPIKNALDTLNNKNKNE